MNPKHVTFNYQAEAEQTNSPHYHATKVPNSYFEKVIKYSILQMSLLDDVKKAIFYGRDLPQQTLDLFSTEEKQDQMFEPSSKAMTVPLVHSIIGIATEAGELLECFDKAEFDRTNFIEEIGDVLWYVAIGLNAVNSTFEEAQRINIAKLRKRYPEKFTEYDANNRDLKAEREVLELASPNPYSAAARLKQARRDGQRAHRIGFSRDWTWASFELRGANEENEWLRGWDESERQSAIHMRDIKAGRKHPGGIINHPPFAGREEGPEIHDFSRKHVSAPRYKGGPTAEVKIPPFIGSEAEQDATEHLLSSQANAERLRESIAEVNKSFEIDGHRLNFQQAQTYIALKQMQKLGELLDSYQLPL